ncbi:putative entry exclusion protein TrbK-alt [Phenylobacterium sp.]|uniref:putative entry exclusion protein TrbK-alt n=1 Tax=Phenylobacterium sp. TaxID=1871053 RepID=UPI003BA8B6A6
MDTSLILRFGAVAFVVLAILATAVQLHEPPAPALAPTPPRPAAAADPLRAALVRCQALGEAGASDAACLTAWAESRRRFLGAASPPEGR